MDLKEREALGESADAHWYYQSKARMLASHLDRPVRHVLDVGAGLGWFSRWMLENGHAETATCVDPGYEADWDEEVAGRTLHFRRRVEKSDADLVLMMDVLEHVDDDAGLVAEYAQLVAPGTPLFATVPAFEFMWSAHDDYLDHRRRYTVPRLRAALAAGGVTPERSHYYFASIFPAAFAVRMIRRKAEAGRSDMRPAGALANRVLEAVCRLERAWMRMNGIGGLTAVALCRTGGTAA